MRGVTAVYDGLASGYVTWGRPPRSAVGSLLAHVRLVRPTTRLWFDVVAPLAFVSVASDGHPPWRQTSLLVLCLLSTHVAGTILNDLRDVAADRASEERIRSDRPLVTGAISPSLALVEAVLVSGVAVAVALSLDVSGTMAAVLLGAVPPVVLAHVMWFGGKPIVPELFWSATWVLLFAIAVDISGGELGWNVWYLAFAVAFMGVGESLTQDIRDADNDEAGARRTTVVVFGWRAATSASWLVQCASLLCWLVYAFGRPLPPVASVIGTAVLVAWLVRYRRLRDVLQESYRKREARLTHVGSIATFTAVNAVVAGALLWP